MGPEWTILAAFVASWAIFAVLADARGWSGVVAYAGGGLFACLFAAVLTFGALDSAGHIDKSDSSPPAAVTASAEAAVTFDRATESQVERIASGLCCGVTIKRAWTARSKAHERAYFVSAELGGPGMDGATAVWMHLGTPADMGLVVSVDAIADEFSDWPHGRDTSIGVTMGEPPARDLLDFVRSQ